MFISLLRVTETKTVVESWVNTRQQIGKLIVQRLINWRFSCRCVLISYNWSPFLWDTSSILRPLRDWRA